MTKEETLKKLLRGDYATWAGIPDEVWLQMCDLGWFVGHQRVVLKRVNIGGGSYTGMTFRVVGESSPEWNVDVKRALIKAGML